MAVFNFNEEANPDNDEIQLGYCKNCNQFHLTAGPMDLSFEVPELAEFLDMATAVYWEQVLKGHVSMPELEFQPVRLAPHNFSPVQQSRNKRPAKGALS